MTDETATGRIFVSYRRDDTSATAGRLYDRLEAQFGTGSVFMDVDSISLGYDFAKAIESAVGSCDVVLAVIGTGWLDAVDERGRRRLDDPDDFVGLEIKAGLDRDIPVVPVLVGGAALPRRDQLPSQLVALARRQGLRLDHDSFNTDITRLLNALQRTLTVSQPEISSGDRRSPTDRVDRAKIVLEHHAITKSADERLDAAPSVALETTPSSDDNSKHSADAEATSMAATSSQRRTSSSSFNLSDAKKPRRSVKFRKVVLLGSAAIVAVALLVAYLLVASLPSSQNAGPTQKLRSHLPSSLSDCSIQAPGSIPGSAAGTQKCRDGLTYVLWPSDEAAKALVTDKPGQCGSSPARWVENGRSGFISCLGNYGGAFWLITWSIDGLAITGSIAQSGEYADVLHAAQTARDRIA